MIKKISFFLCIATWGLCVSTMYAASQHFDHTEHFVDPTESKRTGTPEPATTGSDSCEEDFDFFYRDLEHPSKEYTEDDGNPLEDSFFSLEMLLEPHHKARLNKARQLVTFVKKRAVVLSLGLGFLAGILSKDGLATKARALKSKVWQTYTASLITASPPGSLSRLRVPNPSSILGSLT